MEWYATLKSFQNFSTTILTVWSPDSIDDLRRDDKADVDVVGEDGPNKGKRYPAIYRFAGNANNRELEICYDLSEKERPAEFVSREGTMLLRVTYGKK